MKKKIKYIFVCTLMITTAIPLGISADPISRTIYVDDSNTQGPWYGTLEHPYQFIEDGIEHADPYDTVYVFNGIYRGKTTTPILIQKPLYLVGESKENTIIDVQDYQDKKGITLTTYVSGITIEKFTITCGYMGGYIQCGEYGIRSLGGPDLFDITFRDLKIHSMINGIDLTLISCFSVTIENCDITVIHETGISFNTEIVSNLDINNCYFSNNGIHAIDIYGGNDITISSCEITNCATQSDNAIELAGYPNEQVFLSDVSIHDCHIHNNGCGIYLRDLIGDSFNRNSIYNNEIHDNNPSGISIGFLKYTDIYNNELYNNYKRGIDGPGSIVEPLSIQNTITNNIIYDNGPDDIIDPGDVDWKDGGIYLNGFADTIIEGNTLTGNINGIFLQTCGSTTVHDNYLENIHNGIYTKYCWGLTIAENIITSGFWMGIAIYASSAIDTDSYIYGNTIANMGIWGIYCYSSAEYNNIYHNNIINTGGNAGDADDDGDSNLWYNQELEEGNYYDDYIDNIGYPEYYRIQQNIPGDPIRDPYYLTEPRNLPDISYGPNRPKRPMGPTEVYRGLPYFYDTYAIDLNGDQVYLKIYWGDGENTDWLGPYDSGETCTTSHTWDTVGTYSVKVKAKDEHGNMGMDFSKSLLVTAT